MPPSKIKQELSELGDKYPWLRDPDTTASKAAKAVYDSFVKDGQPKGYYTGLKAAKAVLDVRPDLLGAPPKPVQLSPGEVKAQELAKRMGVKDADEAMRKFMARKVDHPTPSLLDALLPGDKDA
jgi:hypothetical protein